MKWFITILLFINVLFCYEVEDYIVYDGDIVIQYTIFNNSHHKNYIIIKKIIFGDHGTEYKVREAEIEDYSAYIEQFSQISFIPFFEDTNHKVNESRIFYNPHYKIIFTYALKKAKKHFKKNND